jgi:competence protein ComFC
MLEAILDSFFPKRCLGCKKEGQYICKDCETFLSEAQPYSSIMSVWEYEGLMEKLIWKIKYDGMYDIINELVEKAFEKITLELPENTYITYVPMYKKKERERGFNQAELIAKKIGKMTNREVIPLLTKTKDNRSQVGLDPQERIENVKGAFDLSKPSFDGEKPGFRNILLVDDVYTTGATMNECKKVLQGAGIKNIWGFTLARRLSL